MPESHTGAFLRHVLGLTGEPIGSPEALTRAAKANGQTEPRATRRPRGEGSGKAGRNRGRHAGRRPRQGGGQGTPRPPSRRP